MGKRIVGLVRRVSIVCTARWVTGPVGFASLGRGRWVRASPGDKFFRTVGETDSGFPLPVFPFRSNALKPISQGHLLPAAF